MNNIWVIMLWESEGAHVAQFTRVAGDSRSDIMATVSSTVSAHDAIVRARALAKLNCALQGERWAFNAAREVLAILEKQLIS